MMALRVAILFEVAALAVLSTACPMTPPLPPEPDYVVFPLDAEAAAQDPLCRLACESMAKIGCPEAATLDGGRSCPDVCTAAMSEGEGLPTICLANASTADQVRACGQ